MVDSSTQAYIGGAYNLVGGSNAYIAGEHTTPLLEAGAMSFDLTRQDRVMFNDSELYNGMEAITVNFWARLPNLPSASNYLIFGKVANPGPSYYTFGILTATTANRFRYIVTTNGVVTGANSVASHTPNQWCMVTLRYDGTNAAFFINGTFDSQFAKTGPLTVDDNPFYIAYNPNGGFYTTMDFADGKIWNYALSNAEIAALYHPPALKSAQWTFIEGIAPNVIEGGQYAHIVSDSGPANPLPPISSSHMLAIAGNVATDSQSAYLVGGNIVNDAYDTRIIVDDFRVETFDVVFRFEVQGERARRFQDAWIKYPITRDRFKDLPEVYYPDMPGKIYGSQVAHITYGFAIDTSVGDLSGAFPEIGPKVLNAFIQSNTPAGASLEIYLNGASTSSQGSQNCFLMGAQDLQLYIEATPINSLDEDNWLECYVNGEANIEEDIQLGFIQGLEPLEGTQLVWLNMPGFKGAMHDAYIVSLEPVKMESYVRSYIFGAGTVVRTQFCYMGAHQGSLYDTQNCFLRAQPTVEDSQGCFINCANPAVPDLQQRAYISGWDIVETNWIHEVLGESELGAEALGDAELVLGKACYISANLNVVDTQPSFIRGLISFDSFRRAYVVNYIIYNMTDGMNCFINSEIIIEDSQGCFINGGVAEGIQRAYIMNAGNKTGTQFNYIAGPYLSGNKLCFIAGSQISSIKFVFVQGH
jgi:hypothetical protein